MTILNKKCLFFTLVFFLLSTGAFAKSSSPQFTQGRISFDCRPDEASYVLDYEKNAPIPFKHVCFSDKISSSDKTFGQALKEIFPDMNEAGKATSLKARRADWKEEYPEDLGEIHGESYNLSSSFRYLLLEERRGSQLILIDEESGAGVMALFEIKPQLKLTDLISLGESPEHRSMLITPPESAFLVREGTAFFPITYWHDNSGESYDRYELFITLNGKLHRVYDGPMFYGFRDYEKNCTQGQGLQELKPLTTQHGGFFDVSLKVSRSRSCEVKQKDGKVKDRLVFKKVYPATLYWDPRLQKYMGGSKAFLKESPR